MPVWADDRIQTFAPSERVEAGDRKVVITEWQPEHRVFQIEAGHTSFARIRTFFYPHWSAKAGDRAFATTPGKDGAIVVQLPAEATTISLDFLEPGRVTVARIVSLLGWLSIAALFALDFKPIHRFRRYGSRRSYVDAHLSC